MTSTDLSHRPGPHTEPAAPFAPRRTRSRARLLGLTVTAGLVALAVAVPLAQRGPAPAAGPNAASLVPTLAPARLADVVPSRAPAAPGSVTLLDGPFADAGAIRALDLADDGTVTGTAQVVRDISVLIQMDLAVAWYGADGALLAVEPLTLRQPDFTRAFQAGLTDSLYNGVLAWQQPAPADLAPRVASAVVALVSVVNE